MTVIYKWFIFDRHLFFMVLEAGKSKIKELAGESLFCGLQEVIFLLCHHTAEEARAFSGSYFIRALISFMRAVPS